MLLIYNNELYHYGKKGMKWGHRIKRNLQAANRMGLDQIKHPIHSTKAQLDLLKRDPKKALFMTTKDMENLNADVSKRVANSKKTRKSPEERIKKGAEITTKILKTLKAANEHNQNQKRADELRKNGSGTSATITEFANDVSYKTKVDRALKK